MVQTPTHSSQTSDLFISSKVETTHRIAFRSVPVSPPKWSTVILFSLQGGEEKSGYDKKCVFLDDWPVESGPVCQMVQCVSRHKVPSVCSAHHLLTPLLQISNLNSEIKFMSVAVVSHLQTTILSLSPGVIFKNILLTFASEHCFRSVAASTFLILVGPTIREH